LSDGKGSREEHDKSEFCLPVLHADAKG
jgi:hypothetical protein